MESKFKSKFVAISSIYGYVVLLLDQGTWEQQGGWVVVAVVSLFVSPNSILKLKVKAEKRKGI